MVEIELEANGGCLDIGYTAAKEVSCVDSGIAVWTLVETKPVLFCSPRLILGRGRCRAIARHLERPSKQNSARTKNGSQRCRVCVSVSKIAVPSAKFTMARATLGGNRPRWCWARGLPLSAICHWSMSWTATDWAINTSSSPLTTTISFQSGVLSRTAAVIPILELSRYRAEQPAATSCCLISVDPVWARVSPHSAKENPIRPVVACSW